MSSSRRPVALLVAVALVVGANMRPTITSVGPVLDRIGADTGLGHAALGVLTAIPVLAFAVVSPLVSALVRRVGRDRAVLAALSLLVVATVLRSLPGGAATLFLGTALIGAAIAVANVLMPAIVRADFPGRVARATGGYTSALSAVAATASGIALPVARAAGWRVALGGWAALAALAVVLWAARMRVAAHEPPPLPADHIGARVWRSPTAWQVALFMGAQSTSFYLLVSWLPTLERRVGVDPVAAGWHLFTYQVVGIGAALAVPGVLHGRRDLRAPAASVSLVMAVAMAGFLILPSAALLWVVVAGLAAGASLVTALTLIAERASTPSDATRLSGMAQGVGYLVAASGPIGAGLLLDATGSWRAVVAVVVGIALAQATIGLLAGRDRTV